MPFFQASYKKRVALDCQSAAVLHHYLWAAF
jgi:hypothetical protein